MKNILNTLMGIPNRIKILGFFNGKPILHDPKNPAPDNVIYFIDENNFKVKKTTYKWWKKSI